MDNTGLGKQQQLKLCGKTREVRERKAKAWEEKGGRETVPKVYMIGR